MRQLAPVLVALSAAALVAGCGPSSRGPRTTTAATAPTTTASAAALVGPTAHRLLRVEVDHVEGHAPDPAALELLWLRLAERTDHADGVEVVVDDVLPPTGRERHTVDDVRALAAACLDGWPTDDVGVIHVLYLDGEADFAFDYSLAGAALGHTTIVLFHAAIARAAGGQAAWAAEIERSTLVHEAGHVLGLVGDGAPEVLPHQDAAQPGHCDQPGCVMGWTPDEQAMDFCPRCKDDLRAIGGR